MGDSFRAGIGTVEREIHVAVLVIVRLRNSLFCWGFRSEGTASGALTDLFTSAFTPTKRSSPSEDSLNFHIIVCEVGIPIDGRESSSFLLSKTSLENEGTVGGLSSRGNERIRAISVLPTSL